MEIAPFELERWFDVYEADADIMLAETGVQSVEASQFDLDVGPLGYVIPTDGDPTLRSDIAKRYGRTTDEVVLTVGTQEANFLTCHAVLDDASHAVVVIPTYQALRSLPEYLASVTTVETEPPSWELDPDAIAEAMTPATDLVVLANPSNPAGRYHDRRAVEAVYEIVADHDAHLLVDEVYRNIVADPYPSVATLGPRAISTTSITKAYGLAGARLGWVVAEPSVADTIRRWKDYTTISPSILGQHIAKQALGHLEDELLAETRLLAERNRALVAGFIDSHGLSWHEPDVVTGFPTVPPGFDSGETFCRTLFEAERVVLAPGEVFGHPGRFRIGFGLSTPELEAGLERVSRHINEYDAT